MWTLVITQTYPYVYTILVHLSEISVWNVSFLPMWPLEFYEFNLVCYKIHEFFVKTQVTLTDI